MENRVTENGQPVAARPDIRVRLVARTPFFGPGTAQLLSGVAQCGSVYRACEKLGLSYSKGRRMLRELEQQLGEPAVQCTKGGVGGGGACLTPVGRALLERYLCYERSVRHYAEKQFPRYFPPREHTP